MAKIVNGMTVPQLTKKTNYDNWCLQIKTLLGSQDIWDIVESGYEELAEDANQTVAQITALKKTRVKDKSALYFLYNAVDELGFKKIANVASSKEAWDILEVAYKGNDRVRQVRLQALRGEFEGLKMEDKEQVTEYITRVEKVANQLSKNGEPMPASRVVEKILRSLTDDFESIVCAIEESKDLSVFYVEELAGSLEAHEQRRRKKHEPRDQALKAQLDLDETRNTQSRGPGGRGRGGQGRGRQGRGGCDRDDVEESTDQTRQQNWHGRGQERGQGDWSKSEVECFRCGKYGHYARECKSACCYNCGKIGHIAKYCQSEKKEKNLLTEEDDEEEIGILMMMQNSDVELKSGKLEAEWSSSHVKERRLGDELSPGCLNSVWYLDTGASNHMCGDESFFSELTQVEVGLVSCGDDSKMVIKGRGTIRHMQKDGQVGEIRDVYYVPELKSNILSIGQIVEKGNSIMIKNQVLYLKDKHGRLAARVEKEKNLMYKLELSPAEKVFETCGQ